MSPHLHVLVRVYALVFLALFGASAAQARTDIYFVDGTAALAACQAATGNACNTTFASYWYGWKSGWPDGYGYWPKSGGGGCTGRPYTMQSGGTGTAWQKGYYGSCWGTARSEADCTAVGQYSDGAGSCVNTPSCSGGKSWNGSACVCTGGQVDVGGTCGAAPPCSIGKSWDEVSQSCEFPDVPPTCGAGEIAVVNGSGATVSCAPTADIPDKCDYAQGYGADGYFLCSDQKAECEAGGGTHGYIDGAEVCIPDDYSPPICDSGQAVEMSAGGFVCSTPADAKPPTPDDVGDASGGDAGDAGNCNPATTDCDGDGNTDDSNGDGVRDNGGDPTTGTPEASKTGKAAASGTCAAPPVCSGGDPQVCALLRQQWETMCNQADLLENADDNQRSVFEQNVRDAIDRFAVDSTVGDAVDDGLNVGSGGPLNNAQVGTWEGFVEALIPGGGSCSTLSMELPAAAGGLDLTITCDGTAKVRSWLGWAFYVMTALYIFGVVFTPTRS